jgi:transcriptional regulator with XRE-family HTH domain
MPGPRVTKKRKKDGLTTVAVNITRLRHRNGWTQKELADRIGANLSHIARIETDIHSPSLEKLIKLSQVFHITVDELIAEPQPESPREVELQQFVARLRQLTDDKFRYCMMGITPMLDMIQRNELVINPPMVIPSNAVLRSPERTNARIPGVDDTESPASAD